MSQVQLSGEFYGNLEQSRQEDLRAEIEKELKRKNEKRMEKVKADLCAEMEAKHVVLSAELTTVHKVQI